MMSRSQNDVPARTAGATVVQSAFSAFEALDAPGRRGVRIFGLPREHLIMATVAGVLLGIPLSFIVAMVPWWDRVGELPLLRHLNSYVAPAIEGLASEYRAASFPRFPLRRFLIASATMVELVFLSSFGALLSRNVRRHALLVWTCYDRTKLLRYFGIAGLAFFSLWFVLFYDWTILAFLFSSASGGRGKLAPYIVVAMPVMAVVFGHIAAIVALGAVRVAVRKLRRFRRSFL
jgi:hypothetical protein